MPLLTDATIRAAKPREKPYKLSDSGGLYLQRQRHRREAVALPAQAARPVGTVRHGALPGVVSWPAHARSIYERAPWLRPASIRRGSTKQEHARTASGAASTFGSLAQEWMERNAARWSLAYRQQVARAFDKDILPALGTRPIRLIVAADILALMRALERRGPVPARTARLWISQVFQYAATILRADHDPAHALKGVIAAPVVNTTRP